MIEVFKTNVQQHEEATILIEKLLQHFPQHRINFDLSDADKILRVQGEYVAAEKIIEMMNIHNYQCKILEY